MASVILRANQVYGDFIKSLEGESFNGQVGVDAARVSPRSGVPGLCVCCVDGCHPPSSLLPPSPGQVCVLGDCVGGILGFDALCSSSVTVSESQNSSRRGSTISVQVSCQCQRLTPRNYGDR